MASKFNDFDNMIWVFEKHGMQYNIEVYDEEKHIVTASDEEGKDQDHVMAYKYHRKTGKYLGKIIA